MKASIKLRIFLAGSVLLALGAPALHAADGTWIADGDGNWTDSANWSGLTIADGSGNTAFFTAELTADRTVTLNGDRTIGNITFTDGTTSSNNLTISGANILTLAGTTPTINVTQSGRTLTIGSEIAGTSGLIKTGPGSLALTGVNTYTGATTINRGTLNLGGGTATGSLASTSLILSGGALNYSRTGINTQSFSTTSLNAAGAASITSTVDNTLKLGTISRVSGATINFSSTGTFTSTNTNTNGIIGGWAVHNASNWAVANGNDSAITGLGSYTAINATNSGATTNFSMGNTGITRSGGAFSINTLNWNATSGTGNLVLGSNAMTIESGGLLSTGSTQRQITGTAGATRLTAGAGSNHNLIIHQYNSAGLIISAVIGDNGVTPVSVVKAGTNRLDLNGANTYTGATIINTGSLVVNSLANGGSASGLGQSTNAASNLVFNGGSLALAGAGGDVSTNRNFTIMAGGASINSSSGNNVLTWSGSPSYDVVDQARSLTLGGSTNATNIFSGLLADNGTGQLSLTITRGGVASTGGWSLTNQNTFTGSTTISTGLLVLGHVNALQDSYINTTGSATGASTVGLRTTFTSLNLGGLSGDKDLSTIFSTTSGGYGSVTGITLNVDAANNLTYSGVIDGSRTLTKSGAGTQTLSGTNTYTGTTTVSSGVLAVNGSLANTTTTVGNGGTLRGSGSIGGSVTVQNGGTLAAGNSIESLATGTLGLNAGSTFAYEIDKSVALSAGGDLTAITGDLNITAGAILSLAELDTFSSGSWTPGESLTLMSYTGAWNSGLFTYLGDPLTDGETFSFSGAIWEFDYNATTAGSNYVGDLTGSNFVTMTVIPEPSAAFLGGLGVLALLRRRRY